MANHVLECHGRVRDDEHPATLASMNNLSMTYRARGGALASSFGRFQAHPRC